MAWQINLDYLRTYKSSIKIHIKNSRKIMKYYNIFLKDIFNIFISMSRDKKICILNFENKKKDLSF